MSQATHDLQEQLRVAGFAHLGGPAGLATLQQRLPAGRLVLVELDHCANCVYVWDADPATGGCEQTTFQNVRAGSFDRVADFLAAYAM